MLTLLFVVATLLVAGCGGKSEGPAGCADVEVLVVSPAVVSVSARECVVDGRLTDVATATLILGRWAWRTVVAPISILDVYVYRSAVAPDQLRQMSTRFQRADMEREWAARPDGLDERRHEMPATGLLWLLLPVAPVGFTMAVVALARRGHVVIVWSR